MTGAAPVKLALIAGVLTLFVFAEYFYLGSEANQLLPVASTPNSASTTTVLTKQTRDRTAEVAAILARPLFSEMRRPPSEAGRNLDFTPTLPRLTAVVISGGARTVIFADGPGGKPAILGEGGRIGGYTVQNIGAGQATLTGADGTHVIRPMFAQGRAGSSAFAASPSQPSILDRLRQNTPTFGVPGLTALLPPQAPQSSPAPAGLTR